MQLLVAAVGVLALGLALTGCGPRYQGDGDLSGPHIFRPRYVVTFADIPLYTEGTHDFHFRGIPAEKMELILYIKSPDTAELSYNRGRRPFETLGVKIDANFTDDKGNVACHGSGRPSPSVTDGVWVLESGGSQAGYWHMRCHPVQVYPDRTYELTIRVSDVAPRAMKVIVAPTLEGGGIELP